MSGPMIFLAAGLSALAGFVDSTGFLMLGGYFVSFMSGNTTKLAVGLAALATPAAIAGGLTGAFVLGAILGEIARLRAQKHKTSAVLSLVTLELAIAAFLGLAGRTGAAAGVMALAMGAANDALQGEGNVHLGLTYVTGTLVKLGQHLVTALRGGPRFGWAPYLGLWLALALGAVAGALLYPAIGVANLWLATVSSLTLALLSRRLP